MAYSVSRSALLNLGSYSYLFVASLVTTPSLIRHLTLPEFSQYAIALGYLALITSLDLGLSRSVVYYLARSRTAPATTAYASASFVLHLVLGLFYAALTLIWFSPALAFLVLCTYLLGHYQTYPESQGYFGLVNLRAFIIGTSNTFLATLLAAQGYAVADILLALSLATLLTLLIFFRTSRELQFAAVKRAPVRDILHYGLKLQLGKLTSAFQSQYPKFLFAANPLAVTVFSLSSSLVAKAAGAVGQLGIALFPFSVKTHNTPKLRRFYVLTQLMLLVLGVLTIILYQFVGLPLLTWWLGEAELAASLHEYLLVYRYVGLALLLTPLASTLLESRNRPGLPSFYGLLALLIELGVVLLLLPQLQLFSVAYGNLLALVIMVPVLLYATQKNGFPRGTLAH